MFSNCLSVVAAVLFCCRPVLAQTYSSCNPLYTTSCPADTALGKAINVDFTQGSVNSFTATGSPTYDSSGAHFTIAKSGDAPQLTSVFYIMFGKVEITMKAAPGAGIVSTLVLESDDLDEIDMEWLGADDTEVQTNYFGKGDVTTYNRGAFNPASNNQGQFITYTVEWTSTQITWSVGSNVVRVLTPATADTNQYPQTPMRVKFGAWSGGDSSNPAGTISWARGPTDYSKGPFTMTVQSIAVTDYSTGTQYTYGDTSGSWGSIQAVGGKINGNAGSAGSTVSTANVPAITSASPSIPVGFGGSSQSETTAQTGWPWVGATTLSTAASSYTSAVGVPSGWIITSSGKIVPASSAAVLATSTPSSLVVQSPLPSSPQSAAGLETITGFDDRGFPTTKTVAVGWNTISITYDQQGFPITATPTSTGALSADPVLCTGFGCGAGSKVADAMSTSTSKAGGAKQTAALGSLALPYKFNLTNVPSAKIQERELDWESALLEEMYQNNRSSTPGFRFNSVFVHLEQIVKKKVPKQVYQDIEAMNFSNAGNQILRDEWLRIRYNHPDDLPKHDKDLNHLQREIVAQAFNSQSGSSSIAEFEAFDVPDDSNLENTDLRLSWVLHRLWIRALHYHGLHVGDAPLGISRLKRTIELTTLLHYDELLRISPQPKTEQRNDPDFSFINNLYDDVAESLHLVSAAISKLSIMNQGRARNLTRMQFVEQNVRFSEKIADIIRAWSLWASLLMYHESFEIRILAEHVEDVFINKRVVGNDEWWDIHDKLRDDICVEILISKIGEVNMKRRNYLLVRDWNKQRPWDQLYFIFDTSATRRHNHMKGAISSFYRIIRDLENIEQPGFEKQSPSRKVNIWKGLFAIHLIGDKGPEGPISKDRIKLHCTHLFHYICVRDYWDDPDRYKMDCPNCRSTGIVLHEVAGITPEVGDVWDNAVCMAVNLGLNENLSQDYWRHQAKLSNSSRNWHPILNGARNSHTQWFT
ncbi:hypothetical protein G7Y89_g6603 [Cudoniella acicularis]|uniref:chitinase n=1 Tax=Cudoniella acicularis TaxID=354080 RepID=A0A8H4RK39_9HELO|nr:hypothetical protein G7Y89_g6603 [Cudoniella acicularis]